MGGPRQFSKLTDQLFSLFLGAKRDFIAIFNWGYNHFRCVAKQKKEMKPTQAHASTLSLKCFSTQLSQNQLQICGRSGMGEFLPP